MQRHRQKLELIAPGESIMPERDVCLADNLTVRKLESSNDSLPLEIVPDFLPSSLTRSDS